jgi:predicted PurR-regulated permease PerM
MLNTLPRCIKITIFLLMFYLMFQVLVEARAFLVPVTLAALLSFLLFPISKKLEKWGLHRIPAIIISILVGFVVMAGVIFFLYSQAMTFTEDLPLLKEQMGNKIGQVQEFIAEKTNMAEHKQEAWLREKAKSFLSSGSSFIMGIFAATGSAIGVFLLLPIYIFFFTFYRERQENFLLKLSPAAQHPKIIEIIGSVSRVSQKYITGLLIDIAILSVLNSIGFLVLGLKHAILLGVIAAILNVIPYIGVLIGSIFPIAMALLTKDSIWYAVAAGGICVVVQFIDNNLITPKVVGSAVNINPLATLLVLLIGGYIWGVAGMMMFIPLLGILKVIFDRVEDLKPYGYLIGEEDSVGKESPEPANTGEAKS